MYQATVTTDTDNTNTYVGLTEGPFKTRYNNHKSTFKKPSSAQSTELSKYISELNGSNTNYKISWKILKRAPSYNPSTDRCNLCLWEKYFIICGKNMATLNRRNELVTTCRHMPKYLLRNFNHIT